MKRNTPPIYPSVIERNFEQYVIKSNPGVRYLRHPAGVIVVTLAESHEAFKKEISQVKWEVSSKKGHGQDRSKLEPTGKGKKGGLAVFPDTKICLLCCADGSDYTIRAGIRATLVEVNDEHLQRNPNLVVTAASNHGYIAIIVPAGGDLRHVATLPKEFTPKNQKI